MKRDHSWRQQLHIKGRRLLASTIWQDMIINQMSQEEAAENWDLSVEVINEVVLYYESHQQLLKSEADEEQLRLITNEVSFELKTAA